MDAKDSTFTQDEIREIKIVFSMVDKDGSGTIDASELRTIIQRLTKERPSDYTLQRFITHVDTNRDGHIQWEELVAALAKWIESEGAGSSAPASTLTSSPTIGPARTPSRKRKAHPTKLESPRAARARLHKKIAAFFIEFNPADNFDTARRKFGALESRKTVDDIGYDEHMAVAQHGDQKKEEALKEFRALRQKYPFPKIARAIHGQDPEKATRATEILANMFDIVEYFPRPEDRFNHAELFINLYRGSNEVSIVSIIPRIVQFLSDHNRGILQYHAARVIRNFCPGPRVAHTPKSATLHPDKMWHKSIAIRAGCVPALISNIKASSKLEVRQASAAALGALASHDAKIRDHILKKGGLSVMAEQIRYAQIPMLRVYTWAISVLCGHTHKPTSPPDFNDVRKAGRPLLWVLYNRNDSECLVHAACGLNYLLPGQRIPDNVTRRYCDLLKLEYEQLRKVLLRGITDLFRTDSAPTKKFIEFGLLLRLEEILSDSDPAAFKERLAVVELVLILAGEEGYIQDVIKTGLIPHMARLVLQDEHLRWSAIKVIRIATRAQASEIRYLLVKQDIVKTLGNSLTHFRRYDSVLQSQYGFAGPSFNFEFLDDTVECIKQLLSAISETQTQSLIIYFDMELIDKIKGIMNTLVDEMSAEMIAWRENHSVKIEQTLQLLLKRIAALHQTCRTSMSGVIGKTVTTFLKSFETRFKRSEIKMNHLHQKNKKQLGHNLKAQGIYTGVGGTQGLGGTQINKFPGGLRARCFFNGDNRRIDLPANLTLASLVSIISAKYNQGRLLVQYEDEEGFKITIDSPAELRKALATAVDRTLNLYIIRRGGYGGKDGGKDSGTGPAYNFKQLLEETPFTGKTIKALEKQFKKCSRNWMCDKKQCFSFLNSVFPRRFDEKVTDLLFNVFDQDKTGYATFEGFIRGLSILYEENNNDKRVHMAFRAYDKDNDQLLNRAELYDLIEMGFRGATIALSPADIESKISDLLDKIDFDIDGAVDELEFKKAIREGHIRLPKFWYKSIKM